MVGQILKAMDARHTHFIALFAKIVAGKRIEKVAVNLNDSIGECPTPSEGGRWSSVEDRMNQAHLLRSARESEE